MAEFDFIVVGAGIAGASCAFELSAGSAVALLEREAQPGYHSTGRSAALYAEAYGNPAIRAITTAAKGFFFNPPISFCEYPLLRRRGVLFIGRANQRASLEILVETISARHPNTQLAGVADTLAMVPVLRPEYLLGSVFDPDAMDIDVHALHAGYLRGLKARGGSVVTNAGVSALARVGGRWTVTTDACEFSGRVVVNAAGAWADEVALLAGASPIGLIPKRRTVVTFRAPTGFDPSPWPCVIDADEQFYFRPESGGILASPADETPVGPCDVQPEEIDVAIVMDRLDRATTMAVRHIDHRWAGLRTFANDKCLVIGYDPQITGLFWLAGQGGYGIQTAPAASRLAAALAQHRPVPSDIGDLGINAAVLSPARFRVAS